MLRILHVAPYSPRAWAYGGIPRLANTLTREMARQGHHVTLCTTDVCDASSRVAQVSANQDERLASTGTRGVEWRTFPNLSNRLAYRYQLFTPVGLSGYLREHARRFDIAHLHACRNLPGAIAAHYLRKAGVPYVLAPNGTAASLERFFLAKRVFDAVAGDRMVRRAARILAVSQAEHAQLRNLGVPASQISVIPNPVDLDELSTSVARGSFRQRSGLGDAPVVLFLGKMTRRKRVDVLIRAFAQLARPDARLVIAGNDMGAERETRAVVHSLGLQQRTLFTGLLKGRERFEALSDADVLVYPSENEIFGLVPLESLLCGTPVVVADDSGCGEVIREVGGGQVVPLADPSALANALRLVLDSPGPWRDRAREAAARVRTLYAGDLVSARIVEMYRTLLQPAAVSRPASQHVGAYQAGS
jgi:glycosyltransferase involved in cell wall biosynthesis